MPVKIAIADDKPLIINGIKTMLKNCKWLSVVFTVQNENELLTKLELLLPDILLLDILFSNADNVDLCKTIKKKHPSLDIIVLTDHKEPFLIKKAIQNGALGYVLKNTDSKNLIRAIGSVSRQEQFLDDCLKQTILDDILSKKKNHLSQVFLTHRECEILALIAQGLSNQKIADKLFISLRTVETHRLNICKKLNVKNTAGLMKEAFLRGFV